MMDFLILAGSILAKGLAIAFMIAICVAVYVVESQGIRNEI